MSYRATIHSLALLVSGVLLVGTLGTTPAFADEPVEGTPAAQSDTSVAPPTDAVAPDPDAPETDATSAPVDETTPTPTPTSTPVYAASGAANAVTYTGFVTRLSHETPGVDAAATSTTQLFRVVGFGYLSVDFSAIPDALQQQGAIRISLAVPAGVDLGDSDDSTFTALSDSTLNGGALVATALIKVPATKGLVNTTPATAAVHKIYTVLVTPSNIAGAVAGSGQTQAEVAATVAHVDAFWNEQSSGAIDFDYKGTTAWYKSGYSCATDDGSTSLFNEAASRAATQLGFRDALNTHVALIFPAGSNCGPNTGIGLGTVGSSINSGGILWSMGSNSAIGKSTLAHELGHNLSLGHANYADCSSASPQLGVSTPQVGGILNGCLGRGYGDIQDVMGFGVDGKSGGALSSPHAIRAGIWGSGSYVNAPKGAKSYTLKPVSGNAGLRSVVVEDNLGVNYFVEYRDFTGEDAQYATAGCASANSCVAPAPSIRVLRLERNVVDTGDAYLSFKGFSGDDAYLIGRTDAGVRKVGYTAGQSYSTAGITIKVNSITPGSASSASVTVTRAAGNVTAGTVTIVETVGDGGGWEAGTTLTAFIGASFEAEKYAFTWYRSGKAISGATKQSYTLTGADVGKAIKVKVIASGKGATKTATDPSSRYVGYIGIGMGTLLTGSVTTSHSAAGVKAELINWDTPGTVFAYQWYRAGVAIAGATKQTYLPTFADNNVALTARVSPSKSGYYAVAAQFTPARTLNTTTSGTPAIAGAARVGSSLSVTGLTYAGTGGAATSVTAAYQWYRSGVAIAGGTAATYNTVAADLGKLISVRVTGGQAGYPQLALTSVATAALAPGVIAISAAVPVVTKAGLVLTAALPAGALTESGTVTAWKWTRDGAAIAGAIKATYTLTSADYGKQIVAIATITKLAYTTVVRSSASANHSVLASAAPTVSGTLQVGLVLSSSTPTYSTTPVAGAATVTRQWYRSGVAIAGATAASYTLVAADYAKVITVRVVGSVPTFLPAVGTSVATTSVAKGVIAGTKTSATVTKNAAGTVLTAAATPGAITESGVAIAYQWYRNGVAISKATKSTFAVTSADRSKTLHVRLIVTKLNYTSVVLYSTALSYTLVPSVPASIAGTVRVGETLTASAPTYSTFAGPIVATTAYQWYRSGVATKGATAVAYKLTAADLSKVITVRLTGSAAGYLAWVGSSPASAKVAAGLIAAPYNQPVVTRTAMVLKITTVGSVSEPGVAYGYQWYRNGVAIAKATKTSFTLTSLDAGKLIHVRQLASKTAYTSVSLLSTPVIYSVQRTAAPVIAGTAKVEQPLSVATGTYFTHDLAVVPNTEKFQWYRSGVAIAGATEAAYLVVPADLAKIITVRVTNSVSGYLPYMVTSPASAKVVAGDIGGIESPPTVSKDSTTLILTANLPAGSIAQSVGVKAVYQWYRAGVAIPKATAATYKLAVADFNKEVKVQVTVTRTAYTTKLLTSDPVNYSVVPSSAAPVIAGNVAIGQPLSIAPRTYTNGGVAAFQWLRAGVAIAGATNATYTPDAADKGKALSVRVVASTPGFLVSTSTSAATQLIADNYLAGGDSITPVEIDAVGLVITTVATGVTDASATKSYQWYRSGVAIAKATGVSYTAVAADFGKLISVRVIHTKPLHTTVVKWSNGYNASISAVGKPVLSTTSAKRGVPLTVSTPTFTAPSGATVVVSYQWYRSGKAIAGATSATYKPVTADKAKVLTARVVGSVSGLYLPSIQMSAPSKKLA
ncbi:MAG: zinc-dependent metalloprotease family protein [Microbacteriaceae bacterium]